MSQKSKNTIQFEEDLETMEDEDKQLVKEITEPMAKVMSKHMNFLNELEAGKEQRKKAKDNGAAAEIEILRADRKIEKFRTKSTAVLAVSMSVWQDLENQAEGLGKSHQLVPISAAGLQG